MKSVPIVFIMIEEKYHPDNFNKGINRWNSWTISFLYALHLISPNKEMRKIREGRCDSGLTFS